MENEIQVPEYERRVNDNMAVVRVDGKEIVLGEYNSPKSIKGYGWVLQRHMESEAIALELRRRRMSCMENIKHVRYINLTHRTITVHGADLKPVFSVLPSENVARVSARFGPVDCNGISDVTFGCVIEGLPLPEENVIYITSSNVARLAAVVGRRDVVFPAACHPATVRNSGFVVSAPCFARITPGDAR